MTATELSKKLGISRTTVYRLKRQYPLQAPPLDKVTLWRAFLLEHVIDPDVIARLGS
jgi:hypothetical protein